MTDVTQDQSDLREENAALRARLQEAERQVHAWGLEHRERVVEVSERLVLAQDELRRVKRKAAEADRRATTLARTVEEMEASASWKIGRAVVAPLARLRHR